jgi:hypothetical protein
VYWQVSLAILGRRYEDDFNQYHDFEHWPGVCLMLLRTALFVLFLVGGLHTLKHSTQVRLDENQPSERQHLHIASARTGRHSASFSAQPSSKLSFSVLIHLTSRTVSRRPLVLTKRTAARGRGRAGVHAPRSGCRDRDTSR